MAKALLILFLLGTAAEEVASSDREPPLLIDSPQSSLDAVD